MAKGIKKVVLAYSGGLDTSIIIPWLKENYDYINFKSDEEDYNEDDEEGILGNIETEEEWNIIEQIFSSINDKEEVK